MPEAPDRSSPSVPDPLTALRSGDARPLHEQWRERLADWRAERHVDPRLLAVAGIVLVAVLVVPRLVRASEPPIEDSLPFAQPAATTLPPAAPAEQTAPEADELPAVVVLHVAGAVQNPGLVVGVPGWRVADAIAAAGGSAPDADVDRVNLAAPVVDGERLFVPRIGEEPPSVVAGTPPRSAAADGGEAAPIDLNSAPPGDLERLPGVGPVTAAAIVAHRDTHGPFGSVDALVAVRGIGPATVEALRDHATVS